jgi:hypothetical protein
VSVENDFFACTFRSAAVMPAIINAYLKQGTAAQG